MLKFIQMMFSEDSGVSEGRVQSFLLVLAGIGVAFYGMSKYGPDALPNITLLASGLASLGVGGKVIQKSQELNAKTKESKITEQISDSK